MIFDSLNVKCLEASIVTSKLGNTYSATSKSFSNVWSPTLAVIFQVPKTGNSDSSISPLKIPWVTGGRIHCLILFPFPSYNDIM